LGSSNKSSSSSSSTSTVAPPSWAKQNFQTGARDALNLYNSGQGSQVYQGQRVIDSLSPQAQQGQQNLGVLGQHLTGMQDSSSGQNLQDMATGNGKNPYFQQSLQNQLDNARDMTMNQMSASGVTTGDQGGQMARQLGQVATQAYSDQFNKDQQNRLAANNQIDSSRNALWAAQQNAATGNIKAGLLSSALQQMQLGAQQDKFNEEQLQPWKQLGLLGAATRTFSDGYGTTHTEGTTTTKAGGGLDSIGGILSGIAQIAPIFL